MTSALLVVLFAALVESSPGTSTRTFVLEHGVRLEMVAAPFHRSAHKVEMCKVLDWEGVCLIDGTPVFGTDWELPTQRLRTATVHHGGRRISLDVSCMYNPQLHLRKAKDFAARPVEGGFSVRARFSDAAGAYESEWLVINGASVRTSLRLVQH